MRHLPFLIALMFIFAGDAYAARVLNHYDLDSLSAMASLIVKAELGDATEVHTRDGDCAVWDVKILVTLHGDARPQSVIHVAGIEEYRKGPGIEDIEREYPRLSRGDIVYLFLVPKDARMGYAKYNLTNADWKVIESGLRLIVKDRVYAFGQYFPPGPSAGPIPGFVAMTAKTFPDTAVLSADAFEKQVRASLEFVRDLRHRLSTTSLTEAEQRTLLEGRAAVLERQAANRDYIPHIIYDEPREPTTRP